MTDVPLAASDDASARPLHPSKALLTHAAEVIE
jgi:hypothetical protein